MTCSHAGHNAAVEDDVILVNSAAVAGHATVMRGAILSAHVVVHQFCWVGERVMTQGNSATSVHVPPYSMLSYGVNSLVGLNAVGLRRAPDLTDPDRDQIRQGFRLLYRSGLTPAQALQEMDARGDWGAAAGKYRDFIRRVLSAQKPFNRGLPALRSRHRAAAE